MSFSPDELKQALDAAQKAALRAEPILLKYFADLPRVDVKHLAGLVTQADRESEQCIREYLAEHTPDFDFLGEEETYESGRRVQDLKDHPRPRWIVDPLDGTTNFVHGFPIFCSSIGLEYHGQSWVGVIHAPAMKQMFWAAKGLGAHLNQTPIRVSSRKIMDEALVATGFNTSHKDKLKSQLSLFNKIIHRVRGLRRAGAAAYDLAMVASGVFDVFWEESLHPWDTCAGVVLVEEAGGRVSQLNNGAYDPFCETILASNAHLHPEMTNIMKSS